MGRKSIHQLRVGLVLGAGRGNKISHDLVGRSPNDGKQGGNPLAFSHSNCVEKHLQSFLVRLPVSRAGVIRLYRPDRGHPSRLRICKKFSVRVTVLHRLAWKLTNPRRQHCVCSWHKHGHTRRRKFGLHLQLQDEGERGEKGKSLWKRACAAHACAEAQQVRARVRMQPYYRIHYNPFSACLTSPLNRSLLKLVIINAQPIGHESLISVSL